MKFLAGVVGSVVILDQITKLLVDRFLPLYSVKPVIPGFFNLVHARNTGAAFSLFAGSPSTLRTTLFIVLTVAVVGVVVYTYGKLNREDVWTRSALALICGGAIGNLLDRMRLGEVIDFLDLYIGAYHWPAFNVADSAITVGACLMAVSLFKAQDA
ncbi:MAG: signal peptidase II [Syntrophobacteraceae bacterium]|jgi:signal peptidase II|nr:signal peptidase II [Syntrophobacteraceae bacterium]